MLKTIMIKSALLVVACCMSLAAHARADAPMQLNIAAGELVAALESLSKQVSIELVYQPDQIRHFKTKGVRGSYTPEAAVRLLLKDTPLELQVDPSGAMLIAPAGTKDSRHLKENGVGASTEQGSNSLGPGSSAQEGKSQSSGIFHVAQASGRSDSTSALNWSVTTSAPRSSPDDLQELIVTAQRREERLVDTPVSLTVVSPKTWSDMGVQSIPDFADSVPGMMVNSTGAGNTDISLRGVTTGADSSATTAIYIDDVPISGTASFFTPDVALYDLDRIEVLKGPQGTDYGVSSMGGLLKYVTKMPDLQTLGGSVQSGVAGIHDGGVSYNFAGSLNAPLINDELALRVSAYENHGGGYIDNVQLNHNDINESDIYGFRADALFVPTDALSIRLTTFEQKIERGGPSTADYNINGTPAVGSLDQIRYAPEPFHMDLRVTDATVKYNFGPVSLTSITSYQDFDERLTTDDSYYLVPLLDKAPFNFNYGSLAAVVDSLNRKFTQEIRLASNSSRWLDWVVGSFYSHDSWREGPTFVPTDLSGAVVPDSNLLQSVTPTRTDELAGFGDATLKISNSLDVTGGLRYSRTTLANVTNGSGLFGENVPFSEAETHVVTYLGNIRYHIDDNQMTYFRYATGYRPGGPNGYAVDPLTGKSIGPAQYQSDSLKSYEVGYKGTTNDGRFGLDFATYRINWSNIQVQASSPDGFYFIENAPGGATISGAELALNARPVDHLTLTSALTVQDGYLRDADPALGAADGDHLPQVPRFMGNLGGEYVFDQSSLQPSIGASARYIDARWLTFNGNITTRQYHLPDYAVLDVHSGLHFGALEGIAYVRNVFDKRAQIAASTADSVYSQVTIMQPRTIGLTLTEHF